MLLPKRTCILSLTRSVAPRFMSAYSIFIFDHLLCIVQCLNSESVTLMKNSYAVDAGKSAEYVESAHSIVKFSIHSDIARELVFSCSLSIFNRHS